MYKAEFEDEYKLITATSATFSQKVTELMTLKGWDANKFAQHTRLEPNNYYRITQGLTENPSLETVLNICIGLRLSSKLRDELITLAGRSWQNTRLHTAYRFILDGDKVESVSDFNIMFDMLNIDPHGRLPLKDDIL